MIGMVSNSPKNLPGKILPNITHTAPGVRPMLTRFSVSPHPVHGRVGRGNFPPQSLTEPDVSLSTHPAPASHPLEASQPQADVKRNLLLPDDWLACPLHELAHPLCSILITRTSSLLRDGPSLCPASLLQLVLGIERSAFC
jgi:hypothetical protein